MLPLYDDVDSERFSFGTYALFAACVLGFFAQLASPQNSQRLIYEFGFLPARLAQGNQTFEVLVRHSSPWDLHFRQGEADSVDRIRTIPRARVEPWITIFTSLFFHGGWIQFLACLWFLAVFGDNVEDRLGHGGFIAFFLLCGFSGTALHALVGYHPYVPSIGASAAVAGILGAYLVLLPESRVLTLVPFGGLSESTRVPASYFLGMWCLLQFLGSMQMDAALGAVAWWSHLGGLAAGVSLAWALNIFGWLKPPSRMVVHEVAYF